MYYVEKTMEVSACHRLELGYDSKCKRIHGHNWHITIYCRSEVLNEDGMVCDFKLIKDKIHGYLDHGNLNELLDFNPTAENIAKWCTEQINECWKAKVQESDGNVAIYEKDDHLYLKGFMNFLHKKDLINETVDDTEIINQYRKSVEEN